MKKNIWKRIKVLVIILLFVSGTRLISDDSNDKQFKVNAYSIGEQKNPSIASDKKGNFVVTWVSDKQDGELTGIFARRFKYDGTPREVLLLSGKAIS